MVENLEVSVNLWMTFRSTARSYKVKKGIEKKTEDSGFTVVSDRRTILGTNKMLLKYK